MPHNKLKITISNYGKTFTAEMPEDASLPGILKSIACMLQNAGWSASDIAELMQSGDGENVWSW